MENNKTENGFYQYSLQEDTIETLDLLGYKEPTPIQKEAIPLLAAKRDVIAKAQTGSGKTAAFGIPICDDVIWEDNFPQALILEPARELAMQVQNELFQIGRNRRIKVPVVFGGMAINQEMISLKQKSHIVVGTPGRVMDHIRRGTLVLTNIRYIVIDEADLMLDMGFLEEVGTILQQVLEKVQVRPVIALFSATIGEQLKSITNQYMQEPVEVIIEDETLVSQNVEQIVYRVENDDKFEALIKLLILENPTECMIFADTREMVNTLYNKLKRKKIRCGMLHGGMEQKERLYSINDFRKAKFHYLVTTDVAARGIDFEEITHVINYDFPTKKENYVHRIGRTARNGKSGRAISFVQKSEERYLKYVEDYMESKIAIGKIEELELESKAQENDFFQRQKEKIVIREGKEAVFKETITKLTIGGGKKSKMRPGDVVGAICSIDGITQEDIGVIDVRDSLVYVEIMNGKGNVVVRELSKKTIKGKIRKIQVTNR